MAISEIKRIGPRPIKLNFQKTKTVGGGSIQRLNTPFSTINPNDEGRITFPDSFSPPERAKKFHPEAMFFLVDKQTDQLVAIMENVVAEYSPVFHLMGIPPIIPLEGLTTIMQHCNPISPWMVEPQTSRAICTFEAVARRVLQKRFLDEAIISGNNVAPLSLIQGLKGQTLPFTHQHIYIILDSFQKQEIPINDAHNAAVSLRDGSKEQFLWANLLHKGLTSLSIEEKEAMAVVKTTPTNKGLIVRFNASTSDVYENRFFSETFYPAVCKSIDQLNQQITIALTNGHCPSLEEIDKTLSAEDAEAVLAQIEQWRSPHFKREEALTLQTEHTGSQVFNRLIEIFKTSPSRFKKAPGATVFFVDGPDGKAEMHIVPTLLSGDSGIAEAASGHILDRTCERTPKERAEWLENYYQICHEILNQGVPGLKLIPGPAYEVLEATHKQQMELEQLVQRLEQLGRKVLSSAR